LIKAANDAGLNNVKFYTYYGATTGVPTAMGANAAGKVYQVAYAYTNLPGAFSEVGKGFKAKMNDDMYTGAVYHGFAMLTEAFQRAKSTDPVKVAAVMEGMKFKSFNGEVEMRKRDHQLQQGLYISRWEKTDAQNPMDMENTGHTFKQVKYYEPYVASTPTSCEMKRPS
ncbi:MAG: ABC transporter substrate-binding protein, partial [Comamonas sp.]|nr:ABC transporter substrate-binding protein [Candidatus Comamonas equi]